MPDNLTLTMASLMMAWPVTVFVCALAKALHEMIEAA
jgi:hypothetical protein